MSDKLEWTDYLERIASALEESNAINRKWVEMNVQWRTEVEQVNKETREWDKSHSQRLFEQNQDWIDWQKASIERVNAYTEKQNERHMSMYLESLNMATEKGSTRDKRD